MAAVMDTSCQLIEAQGANRTTPEVPMRLTPHAEHVSDLMTRAYLAAHELLRYGALIRDIRCTDEAATIRLHRPLRDARMNYDHAPAICRRRENGDVCTYERTSFDGVAIEWAAS